MRLINCRSALVVADRISIRVLFHFVTCPSSFKELSLSMKSRADRRVEKFSLSTPAGESGIEFIDLELMCFDFVYNFD